MKSTKKDKDSIYDFQISAFNINDEQSLEQNHQTPSNIKVHQKFQVFKTFLKIKQYYVCNGNNSEIVRFVLSRRKWLFEQDKISEDILFLWNQLPRDFRFTNQKQIIYNHLPFSDEIGNKANLYFNLSKYCKVSPLKLILNKNKNQIKIPQTYILNPNQKEAQEFLKSFQNNGDIWILKPSYMNRGQGIKLFKDQESYQQILLSIFPNYSQKEDQFSECKCREIIIQQYIMNPLLYKKRKFDIRVWVLLTTDKQNSFYLFREGYLRLSSVEFSLDNLDLYVHLTNYAIQKKHEDYDKLELGNQLAFADLQEEIGSDQFLHIYKQMRELIKQTVQSASSRLKLTKGENQGKNFELLGFDILIDDVLNVWLLEVNTNPCLETPSPLLLKMIPRMLSKLIIIQLNEQMICLGWCQIP